MKISSLLVSSFLLIMSVSCNCSDKGQCSQNVSDEMTAIDAIMTRTSVRQYQSDRTISADTVELLLRAGMAAPTAGNRQPWEFVVVDTREGLDSLMNASPHGKMLETATLAIVPCGNMERTLQKDAHMMWVQDLSAATENILLAAHALGLGAVWVGVYPVAERVEGISKALQLPGEIIPLCVISIGYPASDNQPKDKWEPERVHYNKY